MVWGFLLSRGYVHLKTNQSTNEETHYFTSLIGIRL